MIRLWRYQTRLPQGGVLTAVSEQSLKEYDYIIARPRWMMLISFVCLFYTVLFAWLARNQPDMYVSMAEYGLALMSCVLCFWTALDMVLPTRWRFRVAIGHKGILIRPYWYASQLVLFPWSEVRDFKKMGYGETYMYATGNAQFISFCFRQGIWNMWTIYGVSGKKLTRLAEHYLPPDDRYFVRS